MNSKIPLSRVVKQTFTSLLHPQVFLLFLIPTLVSILFVFGTFWFTWDFWSGLVDSGLTLVNPWWQDAISRLPYYISSLIKDLAPISTFLLFLIFFALAVPLIIILNLAITSILASTYLVQFLRQRYFPDLEIRGQNGFVRGVWVTLSSVFLFLIAWVITLPAWLIPLGAVLLPLLLTAWLNRRVCLFDALSDVATAEEMKLIKANYFGQSYGLGLLTTLVNFVPFAIIVAPVLTMVAFTFYGLGTLQAVRQDSQAARPS